MQHQDHDLTLVAGLAAGDLATPDRARAQAILDTCTECTAIHSDLIAIAAATRALPKQARAHRDFRLSDEQAAHLRHRSWLRTVLAPFARSATRPLAAAFTSFGLVGLLVVTVLPGLLGGSAASAPVLEATGAAAAGPTAAPAPGATAAPVVPVAAGAASAAPAPNGPGAAIDSTASRAPGYEFGAKDGLVASGSPRALGNEEDPGARQASPVPANPLLAGSLALLALGLLLFGLRYAGRRIR